MKEALWVFAVFLLILHVTATTYTTLLEALESYTELSTLTGYVNGSLTATKLLTDASNFTFFAPSNSAIELFIGTNGNGSLSNDGLDAILQYSLVNGGYPTLSFSNTPQFVASNLVNASYENVTGGQVVDLVMGSDNSPQVITGNKNTSTVTSTDIVVIGGIIHIIDQLFSIPVSIVSEITAANLEYFVSILNLGGYLSAADTYVNDVLSLTDVTFFVPNSEAALTAATNLSRYSNSAEQQSLFEYHVVTGFAGYSPLLKNGMQLTTTQGSNVTITIIDGETYVNAAKVTAFDYLIANGVVHVIDGLLNPSDPSLPTLHPTSTTAPTTSPTTSTTPTMTSSASSASSTTIPMNQSAQHSNSHAQTIGIAVGVTLGVLLLLGALIWFLLRSRKKRDAAARVQQETQMNNGQPGFYYVGRDQHQPMGINYNDVKSGDPPVVPLRSPSRVKSNSVSTES